MHTPKDSILFLLQRIIQVQGGNNVKEIQYIYMGTSILVVSEFLALRFPFCPFGLLSLPQKGQDIAQVAFSAVQTQVCDHWQEVIYVQQDLKVITCCLSVSVLNIGIKALLMALGPRHSDWQHNSPRTGGKQQGFGRWLAERQEGFKLRSKWIWLLFQLHCQLSHVTQDESHLCLPACGIIIVSPSSAGFRN